ncbi:MAG: response regulator, partial [Planctomycetota bacterium]
MTIPREGATVAAPEGEPIRVAVIEDDRRVRESLGDILRGSRECLFAGGFSSGEQALEQLADVDPRVIIVDVNLPGISGVEVIRRIAAMRRP